MQLILAFVGYFNMKFKKILLLFTGLLMGGQVWAQSLAYKTLLKGVYDKDFPLISIEEVEKLDNPVFLDTREFDEYEVSHIRYAKWVGYETFDLDKVRDLDKNQVIVLYCSIGARSENIGKKLQQAGFNHVYNLYGGIFHWVNEGKPVYSRGKKTEKIHAYNRTWGIWLTKGQKVY
ncbi:rhodanese-related sulfurtransferase [Cecembia rubra]|uniref:Rhodanese-related sulfurtransferase n=2 Tax=Cecembia rubra TaxID=1485585 RepID=A0A2P8E6A1_9BACT|nr:rhodanese-related sulfurtransferase [Cecembia rubra]